MSFYLLGQLDLVDTDSVQVLPVPGGPAIGRTLLLLEHADLRPQHFAHQGGGHRSSLQGTAEPGTIVPHHRKNTVEAEGLPIFGAGEELDVDHVARGDAVLLTTTFDHCIHWNAPRVATDAWTAEITTSLAPGQTATVSFGIVLAGLS